MIDTLMVHDSFFTWSLTMGWHPIDVPMSEGTRVDTWCVAQGYLPGYAPEESLTMDNSPGRFEVWYHAKATQPHRYIIVLDLPGTECAWVFLEGVPDLMDYLRLYSVAPLLTLVHTRLETSVSGW